MLIQDGYKHKKLFGMKKKINLPSFHEVFGTSMPTADFNLDAGISNPNQNIPNPQWNCPAYPEGCTYYSQTEVNQDKDKILYSPVFQGTWSCYMENQPMGSPIDMVDAINTPMVYGLESMNETATDALTRKRQPYSVGALNGSLFQGVLSALSQGNSVSFASTWYQSFDVPVNGIISVASGLTSDHNWKFCGVKTINGLQYLIAKPWLGASWGENGFCYFSQAIIDKIGGQAYTFAPATNDTPAVYETLLSTLIRYIQRLIGLESGTIILSEFVEFEQEIQNIQAEITKLTTTSMPEEKPSEPAPQAPVTPSIDTLAVWGTPQNNYHNVGVLCDLAGLSVEEKNKIIRPCIYQESMFDNAAVNHNKNAAGTVLSTDWGICQINDYYHCLPTGTPFESSQYVVNHPTEAVQFMISMYQHGALKQWVSYSSGAYLQWSAANSPMWNLAT